MVPGIPANPAIPFVVITTQTKAVLLERLVEQRYQASGLKRVLLIDAKARGMGAFTGGP